MVSTNLGACIRQILTGRRRLTYFERRILDVIAEKLSPEVRERFEAQLRTLTEVMPMPRGKVVGLAAPSRRAVDSLPRFTNGDASVTVAFVFFEDDVTPPLRSVVDATFGQLDALQFTRKPPTDNAASELTFEVSLVTDLSSPGRAVEKKPLRELKDEGLRNWLSSLGISEWVPTAAKAKRESFRRFMNCGLPPDFLELTSKLDGFYARNWEFAGVSGRHIFWSDENNLYFLAEDDESRVALALLLDSQDPQYLLLDQPGSWYESVGSDLRVAMTKFIEAVRDARPWEQET